MSQWTGTRCRLNRTTLVHFACLYQKDPTGIVATVGSGLTAEQAETLEKLVWETVTGYH